MIKIAHPSVDTDILEELRLGDPYVTHAEYHDGITRGELPDIKIVLEKLYEPCTCQVVRVKVMILQSNAHPIIEFVNEVTEVVVRVRIQDITVKFPAAPKQP